MQMEEKAMEIKERKAEFVHLDDPMVMAGQHPGLEVLKVFRRGHGIRGY